MLPAQEIIQERTLGEKRAYLEGLDAGAGMAFNLVRNTESLAHAEKDWRTVHTTIKATVDAA